MDNKWSFLSSVLEFLSDWKHRVRLGGKVSASINVVSRVSLGTVLGQL